jgi:hypothetical protein
MSKSKNNTVSYLVYFLQKWKSIILFWIICYNFVCYSPLTNFGIEEDTEEPKEAAHLDYKYLKSTEGPLAKPVA